MRNIILVILLVTLGACSKVFYESVIIPSGVLAIGTTSPNASASLQIDSTTTGLLPPRMTTAQKNAISTPATGLLVYDTDLGGYYTYNGSSWAAATTQVLDSATNIQNLGLSYSFNTGAVTINIKQADGATDPTAGSPVKIGFETALTKASAYVVRSVTSATSITIPSGATLGHGDALSSSIYIYAFDDGGTVKLAVTSAFKGSSGIYTTTAIDATADSNGLYSTGVITGKYYRLIGLVKSTQTTAGTWATDFTTFEANPSVGSFLDFNDEIYTATSTQMTPSACSTYIQFTSNSNSLFLPPGKYVLFGDMAIQASGSVLWSRTSRKWSDVNGDNTATDPGTTTSLVAGKGSLYNSNVSANTNDRTAPTIEVEITSARRIYLNFYGECTTAANGRVTATLSARKIL